MKKTKVLVSISAAGLLLTGLSGCQGEAIKPLWTEAKAEQTKTSVVISDLHLGVDNAFAEDSANVPYLVEFVKRAKVTANLDELVIAGDLFDGWFAPFSYGPIHDYMEYYQKVAKNNQEFVDAINSIIKEGKIKVVYVPGNHDVDFSSEIVESIFPGITQARDSAGVGTYRTGMRQEVAIEHGHRYNAFCAPDRLTDANLRQNKVLFGLGYFFTRLAATSLTTGHNPREYEFPAFQKPEVTNDEIDAAEALYTVWSKASQSIGVPGMGFEDKVIPCGLAGYDDYYSMADLVPLYRNGGLTNTLFKDLSVNWNLIQTINRVNTLQDFITAIGEAADLGATDDKAVDDYFNVDKSIDVVIFGHTHVPTLSTIEKNSVNKIYANSGTWIDNNGDSEKQSRDFVKIVSTATSDQVEVFTYNVDGTFANI